VNDSTAKRTAKNIVFLNISSIVAKIIGLLTSIIIARNLGEALYGQFTFVFSLTSFFLLFNDSGMNILTARDVARDKSLIGKYFFEIGILKIFIALILSGIYFLLLQLFPFEKGLKYVLIIGLLYVIVKSFGIFISAFFMAHERLDICAWLDLSFTVIVFAGVLLISKLQVLTLDKTFFIYLFAITIWFIAGLVIFLSKYRGLKLSVSNSFEYLKKGNMFLLSTLIGVTIMQADVIILRTLKGDTSTGFYGIGLTFLVGLLFISTSLGSALYPVFSRFFNESKEALERYFRKSMELLLIIVLPVAMGGCVLSRELIVYIYGNNYLPAYSSFIVIMWAWLFLSAGTITSTFLQATNRQHLQAKINLYAMLINLVLCFVLITEMDYLGASIARLVTMVLILILSLFVLRDSYKVLDLFKVLLKPLPAVVIMGLFIYLFRNLNLIVLIASGGIIYLLMLYITRGIDKDEYELLASLIKR